VIFETFLQLKHHLPAEYDRLEAYVSKLPLGCNSPAHPFGGFVINISACTDAHADVGDKLLCVVIPFGRFTGGELVLHELGLVFRMQPGDVLIFPSWKINHYNLHFQGIRVSIVMHTDKHGDQWVEDANKWVHHVFRHSQV
jgi:hypothetical protein